MVRIFATYSIESKHCTNPAPIQSQPTLILSDGAGLVFRDLFQVKSWGPGLIWLDTDWLKGQTERANIIPSWIARYAKSTGLSNGELRDLIASVNKIVNYSSLNRTTSIVVVNEPDKQW